MPHCTIRLALVVLALAFLAAQPAAAQGACCTFDSCLPAADAPECSGLNGVFLDGEDCGTDPCAPAACCDGVTCGVADAFSCETAGRTYAGAGVTCLDDPCESNVGACCDNGACSDSSPDDCNSSGGTWLGAGTNCAQGVCDLGSCCEPGVCTNLAQYECAATPGAFVAGTDCILDPDPCAVADSCSLDSLYAQTPDNPVTFEAYTSEASAGFLRWDSYSNALGAIETLKWWGVDLDLVGGDFVECTESDNTFQVTFHEDQLGLPGTAVCSYTLPVSRIGTGLIYAGTELNEYSFTLPTPCVLIDGWVSIVGLGDPECWFIWLSSSDGDDFSYCDGCQVSEEGDDLSFCLGGDKGGVFGACCDQSTGTCTDGTEITDCTATGQIFSNDTLCSELSPSCAASNGACCYDDASPCTQELPVDCDTAGGAWLGANVDCSACPQLGACCLNPQSCGLTTLEECDAEGFTFVGVGTDCTQCPSIPECAPGGLFSQSPSDPGDFEAGTSEAGQFLRFENYSGVGGAIESLTWWGLDLDNIGGLNFIECVEPVTDFQISFHENDEGAPGPPVCSYTMTASYTPTGIKYLGTDLNEYGVVLPTPCVLVNGWISIVGLGDPECWFLWMSADLQGQSYCDGCTTEIQGYDLNACFGGTPGGIFGACCDDGTAVCDDNTEITDCLGTGQRFADDTTCAALDPACGGELVLFVDDDEVSWTVLGGGARYDIVRGDLNTLLSGSGDFTPATEECLANNTFSNVVAYTANPLAGEGFWFVARDVTPGGVGSYDSNGPAQSGARDAEIDASPLSCP